MSRHTAQPRLISSSSTTALLVFLLATISCSKEPIIHEQPAKSAGNEVKAEEAQRDDKEIIALRDEVRRLREDIAAQEKEPPVEEPAIEPAPQAAPAKPEIDTAAFEAIVKRALESAKANVGPPPEKRPQQPRPARVAKPSAPSSAVAARLRLMSSLYDQRKTLLARREILNNKILAVRTNLEQTAAAGNGLLQEAAGIEQQVDELLSSIKDLQAQRLGFNDRITIAQIDQEIENRKREVRSLQNQYATVIAKAGQSKASCTAFEKQMREGAAAMNDLYRQADQLRIEWIKLADPFGRLAREEHEAAILTFTEWIVLDGENSGALVARAFAYWRLGQLDKALADLERTIGDTSPMVLISVPAHGGLLYALGKKQQGLKELGQAMKFERSNAMPYLFRGNAYWNEQKYQPALADFKQAVQRAGNDPECFCRLALLYAACPVDAVRNGRKALENARKACELTKRKDWFCLDVLAAAHAEAGEFDKAVDACKAAHNLAVGDNRTICDQHLELFKAEQPLRLAAN